MGSIGVLDSGVGGLTIWEEIVKLLPHESTIYIADSKNCPYGTKTRQEIYKLAKNLVEFLLKQHVKLIVVACNTITVSCLDKLRKDYPNIPIIGTVPVVKTTSEKTKNNKIGILSTCVTANSEYQKELIKKFANNCKVLNIGTDKLVPLIENGNIEGEQIKDILTSELEVFKQNNIDVLALGCSHFPFLEKQIQGILGKNVLILNSGQAIARQVKRVLEKEKYLSSLKNSTHKLYTTGSLENFSNIIKKLKS